MESYQLMSFWMEVKFFQKEFDFVFASHMSRYQTETTLNSLLEIFDPYW